MIAVTPPPPAACYPPHMDGQWFYEVNGERRGPHTLDDMKKLVNDGVIRRQTRVWQPGAADPSPAPVSP